MRRKEYTGDLSTKMFLFLLEGKNYYHRSGTFLFAFKFKNIN